MADYSIIGDTRLDSSGFSKGMSALTVTAGTLIADMVKAATSTLSGLVDSAIRSGASFETSLAKVSTIADTSKISTQELGDQITTLSDQLGVGASDIAEATYQAISAGQDTSNAVAFAGQAAKLAAAGFTSSSSAVDILTTALNAYGLSADQAGHVSDVLLTTQNLGKTSVDELSASMGKVIPLAAAYNVSVENLSSGLAVMTANGIATAEATTYTKSMLNELGDSGSTVGKILQQQTGKSFAQLNADGKSLGDVLQILYDSVDGDSTAFAGLWSSVEAGTGALSLASGGADKFNDVLAQMQNSAGATESAYETMTDTFEHKVASIQTLAENLGVSLFNSMEPALSGAAQWGIDCLSALSDALAEGGPSAMLDAAAGILDDLVSGIVQKVPEMMQGATQVTTSLVRYLSDHQDEIMDAGIQMLESIIIGITDNLPDLITAAAELLAKFAAALISHAPELLECGAALLTTLVDGILRSIENLGEAALACIAKLIGVWDGNMDEWGHIGENIVNGLLNGITKMWDSLVSNVKGKVNGLVSTVKNLLGIHSPSKVFDEIGVNICKGLAEGLTDGATEVKDAATTVVASVTDTATQLIDGLTTTTETVTEIMADGTTQQKQVITATGTEIINDVERTVKTVTTIAADGTKTVAKTIEDAGPQYASAGEMLTAQLRTKLDDGWKDIQSDIETDALGAIKTLATALKNGDLEQLGLWAVSCFWQACTDAQKDQINALAIGALNQLTDALSGVGSELAGLASSLVAKFVPAAATATAGQTALNTAMDANPILLVISLIGMLVGALVKLAGTNKDVGEGFKKVWYGVEDVVSVIFEGILRVIGLSVQGFVSAVNAVIDTYNTVANALGLGTINRVSNPMWKAADKIAEHRKQRQAERNSAESGSTGSGTGTDPDKAQTDAVKDNTKALLTANAKLAEMVKQADSLVLSDNMAVTRSVAASGTAQVAAAARQYTRQGDTVITQNIYSKAQTAADLQREARWEADRARARSR